MTNDNNLTRKKMKKLVLILSIIATCGACAQTETGNSGTLLWEISGNGLSKPSYLLGTLHLKSGDYFNKIPGAKASLQSCEQVVGEINMSDMLAAQMKMQQAMMMTSDTTYRMLYSDEDYQFVSEEIASLIGVGLDQMSMLTPSAIQLTITLFMYAKYFPDVNPEDAIDAYIQEEAKKKDKPVLGLETADDQIRVLFGSTSLRRQADLLLCTVRNMDKMNEIALELIDGYERGDLDKLYQSIDSEICPATPAEMNALNKDRNIAWMEKLPGIMEEKPSFIAVGALHLAGEEGLLSLLEKAGYTVTPVKR